MKFKVGDFVKISVERNLPNNKINRLGAKVTKIEACLNAGHEYYYYYLVLGDGQRAEAGEGALILDETRQNQQKIKQLLKVNDV